MHFTLVDLRLFHNKGEQGVHNSEVQREIGSLKTSMEESIKKLKDMDIDRESKREHQQMVRMCRRLPFL